MNSFQVTAEAVADVERVARRRVVCEREQRRVDQVLDEAQAGDRAAAVDQQHAAVADRARDPADDVARAAARRRWPGAG